MAEANIEAVSSAIGKILNELSGFRFTRLRTQTTAGATTIDVESYLNWDPTGFIVIDGTLYSYSGKGGTDLVPTLTGLQHDDGTGTLVPGTKEDYVITSKVFDYSRTYSAMDNLRRSFFVNYAEGADLSTVGRNVGVSRPPGLQDDEVFREVIKAIAYSRKGTIHAIELALTAFFGIGNFEIIEDFATGTNRNTIFIKISPLAANPGATEEGRAFLNYLESLPTNVAQDEVTLSKTPITVYSATLKDEERIDEPRSQYFSAFSEIRYDGDAGAQVWAPSGAFEGAFVILNPEGVEWVTTAVQFLTYTHVANLIPESDASIECLVKTTAIDGTLASVPPFAVFLVDGKNLAVGMWNDAGTPKVGFRDPGGAFIGNVYASLTIGVYHSIAVRKNGTGIVEMIVDGVVVDTLPYSSFSNSAGNYIGFGKAGTGQLWNGVVRSAAYNIKTATDYWNIRGTNAASSAPDTITTTTGQILGGDVGKEMRVSGTATDGKYLVATATPPNTVTLEGETIPEGAFTQSADPDDIFTVDPLGFSFPDDIGKAITLSGTIPGPHIITSMLDDNGNILDPVTDTPVQTNRVRIGAAPGFATELSLDYTLDPQFTAIGSGIEWELVDAGSVAGSVATLREAVPLSGFGSGDLIMKLAYTVVLSAQLLEDEAVANDPAGTYYPFYLAPSPFGAFESFIDDLTVAGVIPEAILE